MFQTGPISSRETGAFTHQLLMLAIDFAIAAAMVHFAATLFWAWFGPWNVHPRSPLEAAVYHGIYAAGIISARALLVIANYTGPLAGIAHNFAWFIVGGP